MQKKLVGTYTIQDFPPASLEELHHNLAVPVLNAINTGAPPTSPASVPLANVCSMMHTLGLMHDRVSLIYSLIYDAGIEKSLHDHLQAYDTSDMYAVIWEDYQRYKIARQEGEKRFEEELRKLESDQSIEEVDPFEQEFGSLLETDNDV